MKFVRMETDLQIFHCIHNCQKDVRKKLERIRQQNPQRKERRKAEKDRRKNRRKDAGLPLNSKHHKNSIISMNMSNCRLRVAIDLAFEHIMDDILIRKTITQLVLSYSVNRRVSNPLQFFIVNLRGKTRDLFYSRGNGKWDVNLRMDALNELWNPPDIVYLTADSENVLDVLDESKIYVIGGLLDHNRHKGLCHSIALKHGYGHARLPITENLQLQTRKVLTINQVFEILVRVGSRGQSWQDALFEVIPKRKGAELLQGSEPAIEIGSSQSSIQELSEPAIEIGSSQSSIQELSEPDIEVCSSQSSVQVL